MFKIKVFDEQVCEMETKVNDWLAALADGSSVKLEQQTSTIQAGGSGSYRRLQLTFSYSGPKEV